MNNADPRPAGPSPRTLFLAGLALVALMTVGIVLSGRSVFFGGVAFDMASDRQPHQALARRAVELELIDAIPEAELRTIVEAMRTRAAEGDVDAALFLLEVARLQREAAKAH